MKYGICQWNLPVSGPEGCFELKKLGLDGMELEYSEELENNLEQYKENAKAAGIEFPTLGMNIFCNNSYTKNGTEAFFEETVAKALKCASALGVKTLQFPAFFASEIEDESSLLMAATNLKRACEIAEDYGIAIGTENALNLENNIKLFEKVNHQNLKFYFDNQNLKRMKGLPCAEVLRGMKDKLVEVHAKDSLIIRGKQKWMPLSYGECEYSSSMAILKELSYDGWIHLENDYQIKNTGLFRRYDYRQAIIRDLEMLKSTFMNDY